VTQKNEVCQNVTTIMHCSRAVAVEDYLKRRETDTRSDKPLHLCHMLQVPGTVPGPSINTATSVDERSADKIYYHLPQYSYLT